MLCGMRIGALLAGAAVDGGLEVDGLLLWDPYASGRAFLRVEQTLLAAGYGTPQPEGGAVAGPAFVYPAETAAALRELALVPSPGAVPTLILARAGDRAVAAARAVRRCTRRMVGDHRAGRAPRRAARQHRAARGRHRRGDPVDRQAPRRTGRTVPVRAGRPCDDPLRGDGCRGRRGAAPARSAPSLRDDEPARGGPVARDADARVPLGRRAGPHRTGAALDRARAPVRRARAVLGPRRPRRHRRDVRPTGAGAQHPEAARGHRRPRRPRRCARRARRLGPRLHRALVGRLPLDRGRPPPPAGGGRRDQPRAGELGPRDRRGSGRPATPRLPPDARAAAPSFGRARPHRTLALAGPAPGLAAGLTDHPARRRGRAVPPCCSSSTRPTPTSSSRPDTGGSGGAGSRVAAGSPSRSSRATTTRSTRPTGADAGSSCSSTGCSRPSPSNPQAPEPVRSRRRTRAPSARRRSSRRGRPRSAPRSRGRSSTPAARAGAGRTSGTPRAAR